MKLEGSNKRCEYFKLPVPCYPQATQVGNQLIRQLCLVLKVGFLIISPSS